jgi:hypothetical protein
MQKRLQIWFPKAQLEFYFTWCAKASAFLLSGNLTNTGLLEKNSTDQASLSSFIDGAQVAVLSKEDGESIVSELSRNPNLKGSFSPEHSFGMKYSFTVVASCPNFSNDLPRLDFKYQRKGIWADWLATIRSSK